MELLKVALDFCTVLGIFLVLFFVVVGALVGNDIIRVESKKWKGKL